MTSRSTDHPLVLGFGASGAAAARLLSKRAGHVSILDERADEIKSSRKNEFSPEKFSFHSTWHDELASGCEMAVVSPGFVVDHPWLIALRNAGVRIVPEFEFGLSCLPQCRVIAVTGSNGKSSLVKWIAEMLNRAGRSALPVGNYGLPVTAVALESAVPEFLVVELSSFQLEQSNGFAPDVAVLLNIAPNHLDRHPDMTAYIKAKARLFSRMGSGRTSVVHAAAWPEIKPFVPKDLNPILFDSGKDHDYGYVGGLIYRNGQSLVNLNGTWWGRTPLGINAAAGVAAMELIGIGPSVIRESAETFTPLPHRLECVAEYGGVHFVNDSKASTMSALIAALMSGPEKKHIIAGGILKENDVNFVKEFLVKTCAGVYAIGSSAEKLVAAWREVVPCELSGDLKTALARAFERAKPGEWIVLSPGCSSFDQFASYAQRGEQFKEEVLALIQHNKTLEIKMQGVRT